MIIWRAAAVVFQILKTQTSPGKGKIKIKKQLVPTCHWVSVELKCQLAWEIKKKSVTRNSKYWQWYLKCTESFSGSSQLRGKGFAGEWVFYWKAAGGRINVVYRYPKYLLPLQATHLQQTPPWLSSTSTLPFLSVSLGFHPSTFHDCFLPLFAWQDNG